MSTDEADESARHYAGVLVSGDPARLAEVRLALSAIDGVEVHHADTATGRCIVVLESADRTENQRLFDAVGQISAVRSVDLVYHVVDREDGEVVFLEPKP